MDTTCTLAIDGVDLVSYKADPDRVAYVGTIPSDLLIALADSIGMPARVAGEGLIATEFGSSSIHYEESKIENGTRVQRAGCTFFVRRGGQRVEVEFKRVEVWPSLWTDGGEQ